MLKISLTNPKNNQIDSNREKYYQMYREAGIDGLDYSLYKFNEKNGYEANFFTKSTDEIIETYLAKEKDEIERFGLEVCQTHAPFPVWRYGDDEGNKLRLLEAKKCIELTSYLGSKYVIIHPVTEMFTLSPTELRERNLELYGSLIDTAKKAGVIICLENMWISRNGNIFGCTCADSYEANDYIDTLNKMAGEELFGFCFDVGHATLCGKYMKNTLISLGNRVKALHIHDVSKMADLHTLPYSQMGNGATPLTDYPNMLAGLRAIGYRGAINFEADNAFKVFPEDTHRALIGLMRSIGAYFSDEITAE